MGLNDAERIKHNLSKQHRLIRNARQQLQDGGKNRSRCQDKIKDIGLAMRRLRSKLGSGQISLG